MGRTNLRHAAVWLWMICGITATAASPMPTETPRDAEMVEQAIRSWAQSWDKGDVAQYLAHYADDFVPARSVTHQQWVHQRTARLTLSALRQVLLRDVRVTVNADKAQAEFTQHYLDMYLISTARKRLTLVKRAGDWKIREELVAEEHMAPRQAQVRLDRQ